MNSRWQANRIGLINFWYYDEQEFPFVKGRMLLRGANGSGKSVTMQSVVPLLLDGNMSPERLDPFGSRDRKMSSYLLEENDSREERTGYLYLEFKRKDSLTYITIGMGIRARKGKPLDKWYFSLTDGRRVGKDFLLYKDVGEKITLSKKELENRIGEGGCVFDRQMDYMEYVNRHIFGFETADEYKEMVDLLIQLRTPKLSKDFKPSVINDILSDSLQPLSDEDLRPMSEAIENMDTMNMNLKDYKEAKQAAEKINGAFGRYNKLVLYEKAEKVVRTRRKLKETEEEYRKNREANGRLLEEIKALETDLKQLNIQKAVYEKEKESLNQSDALALKTRETELSTEISQLKETQKNKNRLLSSKETQHSETAKQIKEEEERKNLYQREIDELLSSMNDAAEKMAFHEFSFMKDELLENIQNDYSFELHNKQFSEWKKLINDGERLLGELKLLDRQKDEMFRKREGQKRRLDELHNKIRALGDLLVQTENEWKEALVKWNHANSELVIEDAVVRELSTFADGYEITSDFAEVRKRVSEIWIDRKFQLESRIKSSEKEAEEAENELKEIKAQLIEWENQKEPRPERTEAVINNRKRLDEAGIPYQEFYKVIEFGSKLDEDACNHLEEAFLNMGILDALIVEEKYREQVLEYAEGCEDRYLFEGETKADRSLLDILQLNDEINDLFSNIRLTNILSSIAYDSEGIVSVAEDGRYCNGIMTGTITGQHKAEFLGTKARERSRLAKIEECRIQIKALEEKLSEIKAEISAVSERKTVLEKEYQAIPDDGDMREAAKLIAEQEREYDSLKSENSKLDEELIIFIEEVKEKRKSAVEISDRLYLTCSYEVFLAAKTGAEAYDRQIVELKSSHAHLLRSLEGLKNKSAVLENIESDMNEIRRDIVENNSSLSRKNQERNSIISQLELTDYQQIRERLDECVRWLNLFPSELQRMTETKARKVEEAKNTACNMAENEAMLDVRKKQFAFYTMCYEREKGLFYVFSSEEAGEAVDVYDSLLPDVKNLDRENIMRNLNQVYYENRGFLSNYQLAFSELFGDTQDSDNVDGYNDRRLDFTARYQGARVSFPDLMNLIEKDISELENLIKDGDRELFEDILANTISRKIRGKINSSNAWVQKMNSLMNGMDTSSGLKLSLRWRSKTAEKEDQLDTRDLVELLKKDYRLMGEEEAERLSSHFRSKVEEARRSVGDSGGRISFYQIMKETLDYRKWFEFQLFFQKTGERQRELTNNMFGTFSGGEKAMSMYVPLFSAVVAKYQGGREDAPRLISLDEAFAGVDSRNIRDMFRLMRQFEFDFIINSQVLWGDCDTLDALAIYQLIRPENAKFVTIMPYLWNGISRENLEDEEAVEQRGLEIDKSE